MEKNLIKEQLKLIEKLLKVVNSKGEYYYLLREKAKLKSQLKKSSQEAASTSSEDFRIEFGDAFADEIEDFINSYPYPVQSYLKRGEKK